ncbi:MAG: putrescine carbamoyltransferase [Ruminococcus sp.]|nr:putrescine carbamoyltransferase [Ruminococcus sp.]
MGNVKHFMDCWDYSNEELMDMAELIMQLKKDAKAGRCPKLLKDRSLAMIFNGNSTRTRVSFEVAATQLGAHALYLTGGEEGELHLGKRETIGDTATVVSSMVDGIAMRWRPTLEMEEFAKNCSVPFFNGMDHTRHPTQTLCDFVTILENLPEGKELKDVTLTFIGSTGVRETSANDLAKLLPRFGATVILSSPEGYVLGGEHDKNEQWMIDKNVNGRRQACAEGGGKVLEIQDPKEAVQNADYIYTGCFCYEGTESKSDFEIYERDFISKGYQVTKELLSLCPNVKTMHYLPALRGKEMTDYTMDYEGSLLWKQAENRLHTQRGLMAYLMGPLAPDFYAASKKESEARAKEKIREMREKYGTGYTHK